MTPPPPPTRRMTREDIVHLAQSGKSWEFLSVVAQALRIAPADDLLRLLAAAHLARLGLAEPALEQISLLQAQVRKTPEANQIASAAARLKPSRLDPDDVQRTCEANARVLTRRGVSVAVPLARWWERAREQEWFRTLEGQVIRRPRGSTDLAAWRHLDDPKGQAEALVARHFVSPPEFPRPIVLEGIDPPYVLQALMRALPKRTIGHWPRVVLIAADALEFLDGLALADLRTELGQERLEVFIGPDATERYELWMRRRLDQVIVGPTLALPSVGKAAHPSPAEVIARCERLQAERMTRLASQVQEMYSGRDRAWWEARYRAAGDGSGEPLRVLICTCRYSTYIRHSATDLAGAFERAGCSVRLLIEPDDSCCLAPTAYLRQIAEHKPDLIVLINYTRATLGDGLLVEHVPVVTWIQDAMPHLFRDATGKAMGELDFVVGHLHESLFSRHGYARERSSPLPVTADSVKFHAGAVDQGLSRDLMCDVACITHHSETPAAMHERLLGDLRRTGADSNVLRVVEALYPRIGPIMEEAHACSHHGTLRKAVIEASREAISCEPIPAMADEIFRHYALPIADRVYRHQALHWAAAVCVRHGWRLHIYGRGWSSHPSLSSFAQGELDHGDMLRAAYNSAKVNLHVCASTLVHQRVLECILSGGLVSPRIYADALADLRCRALAEALSNARPHTVDERGKHFSFVDTPTGMLYAAAAQRMGITDRRLNMTVTPERERELQRMSDESRRLHDPNWLFGDLSEVGFSDEASLERIVLRARSRPHWRQSLIDGIRGRIGDHLTTDSAARAMLTLVTDSLCGASPRRAWIEAAA
ncbi:MAG: hypothetical protein KF866_00225 [Phycisphaeraceae bacterium]|nr:hypothetical protein [Phycisphaeraceae bacterium]